MIERIASIKDKVKELIENNKELNKAHDSLLEEMAVCQDQLKETNAQIMSLKQELEVLNMAKVVSDNDQNPELKQKIDKFIREIDKCIALMTQQ